MTYTLDVSRLRRSVELYMQETEGNTDGVNDYLARYTDLCEAIAPMIGQIYEEGKNGTPLQKIISWVRKEKGGTDFDRS